MSYSRTTSSRSGWAHHLPAVKNTSIVLNSLSHSTTRPDWEREVDIIIRRCHSNAYNYCNDGDQQKFGYCFEAVIPDFWCASIMVLLHRDACSHLSCLPWLEQLKYGSALLSYCPMLDKRIAHWDEDDGPQAEIFHPVLRDERKDVLAILLWVVIS